jgi:hypothetical protein
VLGRDTSWEAWSNIPSAIFPGIERSGRIDRSNQGDVRNMLRADTPMRFLAKHQAFCVLAVH